MLEKEEHFLRENAKGACCSSPEISDGGGFQVCVNCGSTFDRILDNSQGRMFNQADIVKKKTSERVSSPVGPRTNLKSAAVQGGQALGTKSRLKFDNLDKTNKMFLDNKERNITMAHQRLKTISKTIEIPNHVFEDAFRIYENVLKKQLIVGRDEETKEGLLFGSLYGALKIHGVPRVINELLSLLDLPKKKALKCYNLIKSEVLPDLNLQPKIIEPETYVDKFCSELNLSMNCRNVAIQILKVARKERYPFSGKDPKGIAAGAIYLSTKHLELRTSQKNICDCAGVNTTTLRSRIKELAKHEKFLDMYDF